MTLHSPEERAARGVIRKANRARRAARPKPPKIGPKGARSANPKADRGRGRDNAYLAFLRRHPRVACGRPPPCDPAHIRTHKRGELPTGMGRKPDDARATALCRTRSEERRVGKECRSRWSP